MQGKKAYLWNFIGRVIPQGLFLVTSIILARFLTPEDFGAVGVLTVFITIATTLTDSGMGGSLIKEKEVSKQDCATVFLFNGGISLTFYALLFFIAPWVQDFFHVEGLATIARVLGLVFVIGAWGIVPRSLLIKDLKFKGLTAVAIGAVIIASIVAIIGCFLNWGAYAIVAYQLTNMSITTLGVFFICRYKVEIGFSKASFKKLFSFGAYTTISNVIDSIYENIMSFLFGRFMSIQSAGYFYQSQKIESVSTNSWATTINTVSFPILTKLRDAPTEFHKEANNILFNIVTLLFPIFALIASLAKEILHWLFGLKWTPAAPYLSILMFVGMVYIMESVLRNNIKSLGQVRQLFEITLAKRIVGLGMILGALLFSSFAMMYGYLLATILGYLCNLWLYTRLVEEKFFVTCSLYLKYLIMPGLVSGLLFMMRLATDNMIVLLPSMIGILGMYYLAILPKIGGLNLLLLAKQYIKK